MSSSFYSEESQVTPFTKAILPEKTEGGRIGSRILEKDTEYIIKKSPSKVIDLACKFFGKTLIGLQEGTKEVCNFKHKLPISIDVWSGMYFLPTMSPTNSRCAWINHTYIENVEEVGSRQTRINFKDGSSEIIGVSHGSLLNQINRTAQYRFILDERIKSLRSK